MNSTNTAVTAITNANARAAARVEVEPLDAAGDRQAFAWRYTQELDPVADGVIHFKAEVAVTTPEGVVVEWWERTEVGGDGEGEYALVKTLPAPEGWAPHPFEGWVLEDDEE